MGTAGTPRGCCIGVRVMLRGRVDEATAQAYYRWLAEEGITFTAFLEAALGREIAAGNAPLHRVVRLARQIDQERGNRR